MEGEGKRERRERDRSFIGSRDGKEKGGEESGKGGVVRHGRKRNRERECE